MHVFFSVGEPSGDQHAAHLIKSMQKSAPDLKTSGLGGPDMAAAGCRIHYQLTDLAVVGIVQVLPLIFRFISVIRQAGRLLESERPDVVVLVDFPGFNWWVARKASKLGIPVIYYMPPQIWAWGTWRLRRVKKWVNRVLCALPFEYEWYRSNGVDAEFVGHPFFDEVAECELDRQFLDSTFKSGERVVGVLPGSRNAEVQRNFPIMLRNIARLKERHADVRFPIACYRQKQFDACSEIVREAGMEDQVELYLSRTPEIIEASDFCLMVSGSVSLEMMARRTPAVVQYQCSWLTFLMAKTVVRIKYMTLPNLIADRKLLPEELVVGRGQKACENLYGSADLWLSTPTELEKTRLEFGKMADELVEVGALDTAAEAILGELNAIPMRKAA